MRQYDIYNVDLNPTIGCEIGKIRPCLIISDNSFGALPSKIIIPFTDWKPKYANADWMVKVNPSQANGLNKISALDCYQISNVDYQIRFSEQRGTLEHFYVPIINSVLMDMFNLQ